jgi:hypothetical protein
MYECPLIQESFTFKLLLLSFSARLIAIVVFPEPSGPKKQIIGILSPSIKIASNVELSGKDHKVAMQGYCSKCNTGLFATT